jgi:hypothetical protein
MSATHGETDPTAAQEATKQLEGKAHAASETRFGDDCGQRELGQI